MLGLAPPTTPVPWFWSDQAAVRLQVAGVPASGRGSTTGRRRQAMHLHLDEAGRVVGAVSVNRPRDLRGAQQLIGSGVVRRAGSLADESVDLRQAARTAPAA